ncbi:Hypothetical protein Mbur_2326 [Methanococcoides burtonii DSM 6242]|uniref:Uncharacterized protein n=1 Tax=Methanococcoides burtonii (strain DSM 6242 / NBRC 107633 / OCM 468 / ACE-M) TaxID=259564 RepID=Q12TP6_METBU|nr:Hypothetical protein Mbur_2326 [Methanococcoides burtonii DSM 6242]
MISVLADLSLTLQVIAFVMLLYAINLRKEGLKEHGRASSLAVYVMVPTILYMFYSISLGFRLPEYGIILGMHRLLGSIVLIFIILFVTNRWRFKKKFHMDIVTVCWTLTLMMGIAVYLISHAISCYLMISLFFFAICLFPYHTLKCS